MSSQISNSVDFFLWDYENTLFPLGMNKLLVEFYSSEIRDFLQEHVLGEGGSFQPQRRVFASKRGWFLRRTVKLDPVAEFFFYDLIYRNRSLFRRRMLRNREVYGFNISGGSPESAMSAYTRFKSSVAAHRDNYSHCAYFDVVSYFNHVYHHDLVAWFEGRGAQIEDVNHFGKFLREAASGRSVDCLPQGIYPAKMVGSGFLSFLDETTRTQCEQSVRLMDDVWYFDNKSSVLVSDFLLAQSLLGSKGLSMNDMKSAVLEGARLDSSISGGLDQIKIDLLRKRRSVVAQLHDYGDDWEEGEVSENPNDLTDLEEDEQHYLIGLLKKRTIQEEDAELVITLMGEFSEDILEYFPLLVRRFPNLVRRLHHFCEDVEDKEEVASILLDYVKSGDRITEFQLFWFGRILEDYLLRTRKAGPLLASLFEHSNATDISKAKILEIPEKGFGLPDLRSEQLQTGQSGWLAWSAAVGARVHPKGQRNQMLKYFRRASPMNRLIGEFVEKCPGILSA